MEIMGSRYRQLQEALEGYQLTGTALISQTGQGLGPAGVSDDIGAYYFIPKIAVTFALTLDQTIELFYGLMMAGAVVLSAAGFILFFRSWASVLITPLVLGVLGYISFAKVGDVYLVSCALPMAIVPLFSWLAKVDKGGSVLTGFSGISGVCIGLAHYMRAHAGTGLLLYLCAAIFWHLGAARARRIATFGVLIAGVLMGHLFFQALIVERDRYLLVHAPGALSAITGHPFWHSIYIGFGFLSNDYGIQYLDQIAIEKVRSIAPSAKYLSEEYEITLRQEVMRLVAAHPLFTSMTLFAKSGVIAMYVFLSVNLGLVAAKFKPIPRPLAGAFWSAIVFSSLPGLLVIPSVAYLLGMITCGVLYGLYSANHFFSASPLNSHSSG